MIKLGKLQKVDLKELWKGEATDFTPWLAMEDNMNLLGETVGIDLEMQEQEKSVGPFRADILCKNTVLDHYVLIENQLERTDHTHLGQILTYAAGLDAFSIIWIARKFSEEHRAALDWLNNITDEGINFFGIEIEAYRIGESLPAPMFNIVAKPNDWTKSVKSATTSTKLTETKQLQLEYWQTLKKFLEESGTKLRCQKPQAAHWYTFALGRSYFYMYAIAGARDGFIRIDVYFDGKDAKNNFHKFKNNHELEAAEQLGTGLVWDELPDAKSSSVSLKKTADLFDLSQWKEQHEWFRVNLEKFDQFFRPRIRKL